MINKHEEFSDIEIHEVWKEKENSNVEVNDLYIVIDHSSNRHIDEEQAKKYLKEGVYFTVGNDDFWKTYIFDLEKNSILPEVRFLDWYSWSWWKSEFNIFWPWFFFILSLVWIFVYYSFFGSEEEVIDKPETSIVNSVTWLDLINQVEEKPVLVKKEDEIRPIVSNNSKIDDLNSSIRILDTELQIKNLDIDRLTSLLNICKEDLSSKSELLENIRVENSELQTELSKQVWLNLQDNQLFLSIWQKMFDICEEQDSKVCKDFVYDFYQLRDIENEK